MSDYYWQTVGVSGTGAFVQQRFKLLGGDVLVPTEKHRYVRRPSQGDQDVREFEIPA